MSINNLFEKGNKFFLVQNYIGGLEVYKQIFFKYPKNIRIIEEITKKIKKYRIFVISFSSHTSSFFVFF